MSAAISTELADVIAMLEARVSCATAAERQDPNFGEVAQDRRRQCQVIIDDLRAGLHHGCVQGRAMALAVDAEGIAK